MAQKFIREIRPHVELWRDDRTGIAQVKDGTNGTGTTAHPSIAASGSVRGMKDRGWWSKKARTVRAFGFIYNIDDMAIVDSDLDQIAAQECRCQGCIERILGERQ